MVVTNQKTVQQRNEHALNGMKMRANAAADRREVGIRGGNGEEWLSSRFIIA